MTDIVGTGQVAMHAVERRRLGRAQMGAAILHLVPLERENPAVGRNRGRERRRAIGAETEPVRCSRRSSIHLTGRPTKRDAAPMQDDIGEDALFDAEAAAGVWWRA